MSQHLVMPAARQAAWEGDDSCLPPFMPAGAKLLA